MSEMISILSVEEKLSKNNKKFYAVSTDKGKMSAWDSIVADYLKANIGKVCEIEMEVKGTFKNITKFIKATDQKANTVNTSAPDRMAERLKIDAGNTLRLAVEMLNACTDLKFAEKKAAIDGLAEKLTETFIKVESKLTEPTEKEKIDIAKGGEKSPAKA